VLPASILDSWAPTHVTGRCVRAIFNPGDLDRTMVATKTSLGWITLRRSPDHHAVEDINPEAALVVSNTTRLGREPLDIVITNASHLGCSTAPFEQRSILPTCSDTKPTRSPSLRQLEQRSWALSVPQGRAAISRT